MKEPMVRFIKLHSLITDGSVSESEAFYLNPSSIKSIMPNNEVGTFIECADDYKRVVESVTQILYLCHLCNTFPAETGCAFALYYDESNPRTDPEHIKKYMPYLIKK